MEFKFNLMAFDCELYLKSVKVEWWVLQIISLKWIFVNNQILMSKDEKGNDTKSKLNQK